VPQFRYTAIGPGGDLQHGVMEAASEAEVIARMQRQGRIPMRAEPAQQKGFISRLLYATFESHRNLRKQELADLIRELATMLGAGQDLDRALRYLQETASGNRVRRVADGLREAIRDGSPLAAAMARHPGSFSQMHVGLVRAGEASGQLATTLARLADLLDQQRRLAATITTALVYPALLVVASVAAVALLLTEVLPQFAPLFEQSGAELPASTQFLIGTGAFLSANGVYLILVVLALSLLGGVCLRKPPVRLRIDRLLLRLPIIGRLLQEVLAARFTRVLGTLLVNGVPLIGALGIVRNTLNNLAAAAIVDSVSLSARGGGGLSQPLAEAQDSRRGMRIFPSRTMHLLRLGEENAELGPMALRAADIHEEKTRLAMQRLIALLIPTITIVMGIMVAGIVTSLLTAMLSLNDLATR